MAELFSSLAPFVLWIVAIQIMGFIAKILALSVLEEHALYLAVTGAGANYLYHHHVSLYFPSRSGSGFFFTIATPFFSFLCYTMAVLLGISGFLIRKMYIAKYQTEYKDNSTFAWFVKLGTALFVLYLMYLNQSG